MKIDYERWVKLQIEAEKHKRKIVLSFIRDYLKIKLPPKKTKKK